MTNLLETVRTAAADCSDNMARNELLDAAAQIRNLLQTIDVVCDGLSADTRTADGMTKANAVKKLRQVVAEVSGK